MNNIAQSSPEGELERLRGVPRKNGGYDEGQEEKAQGAATGGSGEKKGQKWPIVVVVLVILAAVGGGVAWWVVNENKDDGDAPSAGVVDEWGEVAEDSGSGEDVEEILTEIDINDETVQKVYGGFVRGIDSYYRDSFYINQRVMEGILTEKEIETLTANSQGMTEVGFGEGVEDDTGIEVVDISKVATDVRGVVATWLDKAETEGDKLYLYELALACDTGSGPCVDYYNVAVPVYMNVGIGSEGIGKAPGEVVYTMDMDNYDVELEEQRPSWTTVEREKLNYYKWTFEKQADGGYVYRGVERIR